MKDKIIKRSLKRNIAFLLSLSMVCSFSQPISVEAGFSSIFESPDSSETIFLDNDDILPENSIYMSEDSTESTQSKNDTATDYNAIGRIDVSIGSALFLDNNIDFTVTLMNNNDYSYSQNYVLTSENPDEDKIIFDNLKEDEYTLTVTAPGFVTYSQNINVAQKMYSVKLTAGFCAGYAYENEGLHPGVLLIGDVNADDNRLPRKLKFRHRHFNFYTRYFDKHGALFISFRGGLM